MTNKRILLIEDEKWVSDITQICLRKVGGWTVTAADSGAEGLRKAETEQPDAILLDVMMPDLNGLVVLERLKQNSTTQAIPVILLTAKVQGQNHHYANAEIAGVIAKPFDPLRLPQQIMELLGWV